MTTCRENTGIFVEIDLFVGLHLLAEGSHIDCIPTMQALALSCGMSVRW
jgi:hypothetical protein